MAAAPKYTPPKDSLEIEALDRLEECRRQKSQWDRDLREGYFFAAPHRARNVSSRQQHGVHVKLQDASLLNTSFAFEMCGDFPTVIMNTFMPQTQNWAVRRPGLMVPPERQNDIEQLASDGDNKIFKAIGASNFYAECGKGFNPDLALGTIAMWIDHRRPYEPIKCQVIPIRELEINIGPHGEIDDRWVVRYTKRRKVKALTKGIKLPQKILDEIDEDPAHESHVKWGFWRLWSDDENESDERWQYIVMVDDTKVFETVLKGEGACPLVVARFNASPEWAWGNGPLIQALPDLRVIDELSIGKVQSVDFHLRPPITWPDNSIENLENDIEAGRAYPIRPGSAEDIKNIYLPPPLDPAIYFTQDLEQRIKRLFFLDFPQQRGDTPPTATQWLDQMTLAQQRIGTPGLCFWQEWCAGIFTRFQYLLEKAGVIAPVKIDGKLISLYPYNPAQKAAERQDAMNFAQFSQIGAGTFPEEWKVQTDGAKTLPKLAKTMGADKIWTQRNPDDVKAALATMAQAAQGSPPTAPNVEPTPVATPNTGPSLPAPMPPRLSKVG